MALFSSLQCKSFVKTFAFDIPNFLFHAKLISQCTRASLHSHCFRFGGLENESYHGNMQVGSDPWGGIEFRAWVEISFPDLLLDENEREDDERSTPVVTESRQFNVGVQGVIKVSALPSMTSPDPVLCFKDMQCHVLSQNSPKLEDSNVFDIGLNGNNFVDVKKFWNGYSDDAGARMVLELRFFYSSGKGSEWEEEKLVPHVNKLKRPPAYIDHFAKRQKTDVTIECNGKEFDVHKIVLASASPVFDRMLDTEMSEKETGRIQIKDFQPEAVQRMLDFLYTGTLFVEQERKERLPDEVLIQLLDCAEKYGIHELKDQVGHEICENVTVTNAIQFVDVLKMYKVDEALVSNLLAFCKKNLAAFTKDATFKEFLMEYTEALI